MKKTILLLCSLFVILHVHSQITVKYSVGYGAYNMSEMKSFMEEAKSSILVYLPGLDITTTDNFPGYVTHTFDIGYKIQKHEAGITATHLSTAGKFSYSDYSGKISSTMKINGYRTGFYYKYNFLEFKLAHNQRIFLFAELSPSILYSKIKLDNEITPDSNILKNKKENYSSTSLSILPQIGFQYSIISHIGIFCSSGYDINCGGKIDVLQNKRIDWSGFRLRGGISLSL